MALTAAQIVSLCCQIAHTPGWTAQAGQLLNMILNDLSQTQDLELTRGKFNFNTISDNGSGNGMGPYALPLNYWRHTLDGVFYTISGVPYTPINLEQSEFDQLVVTTGLASYPEYFYTDISPLAQDPPTAPSAPLMWMWPPSNGVYPVTVRYYKYLPDITAPETSTVVPWFPNQNYLITELSGQLMKLADDTRWEAFLSDNPNGAGSGALLRKFMQMQSADNEGRPHTVTLDRRRFGSAWGKLPDTKKIGFFTG